MNQEYRMIRKTLDVIVPLVGGALIIHGAGREAYEWLNNFPKGSNLGEIAAGTWSILSYYFIFRRQLR